MIKQGAPLLLEFDKGVVEDILNCPLRVLNHKPVLEALKGRIMQSVGLKYFSEASKARKDLVNPLTNEPIDGVISLGNHPKHV
jgi:hypothetical protein